jgi:hypothetical protein
MRRTTMPTTNSKSTKRRTQTKDLSKQKKDLSKEEQKKVKGGILPYMEQDNLYKNKTIKDGASNTLIGDK